jgi:hypothetical protein
MNALPSRKGDGWEGWGVKKVGGGRVEKVMMCGENLLRRQRNLLM